MMIFWTFWRSYFIFWQIFGNKVWCPVSKKRKNYFHFLLSRAYPIDRLDWSLFSAVIVFYHWFPLLDKIEIRAYILPRNFPAVLIIFTGRGGAGNPPFPTVRGVHPWPEPHWQPGPAGPPGPLWQPWLRIIAEFALSIWSSKTLCLSSFWYFASKYMI